MSVTERPSPTEASAGRRIGAVDVCICTFNRPAIAGTLRSLAHQECEGVRIRIVVVDHASTPEASALVAATARELGLDVTYRHAPANNISIARNACLDAVTAEYLAFLDDDEVASPGWLRALTGEAQRGQWDAVLGPVQAIYSESAPRWLRSGDFHSTRPVFVRGQIETGYTGNVLIRREAVERRGLKFRTELGRSGGEDEDFFNRLRESGGKIGYAPEALAFEAVPSERATLHWLLRRSFRCGQTYGGRLSAGARGAGARFRAAALASAKAGFCALVAAAHLPLAARRNGYLARAALHCGVVARLAGLTEVRLY